MFMHVYPSVHFEVLDTNHLRGKYPIFESIYICNKRQKLTLF